MLRFLRIKHLAVIDAVEVEFDPGLNVLTGETGAGKSILVEAVGLLLGGRASGDLVRTGEDAATIEAIFESGGEELLVRREITAQGRSRAFINGALATAGALKDLSARLVELHGQHEHQTLLDPATHLDVLDAFGGLEPAGRRRCARPSTRMRAAAERARARCGARAAERDARQELVAFQLGELDRAALEAGERRRRSWRRRGRCWRAPSASSGSARKATRRCTRATTRCWPDLGGVWRRVAELAALDPQFQPYLDARDGIKSQLEDLALFLRRYADGIDASPARLQQVEDRLALLERLKRKYGPTLADVIAQRDGAARASWPTSSGGDERLAELEREHARGARRVIWPRRETLSAARRRGRRRLRAAARGAAGASWRWSARGSRCASTPSRCAEAAWTAAGIDRGGVLRVAEPRRGSPAAGAHRVRRRAVADHAGDQDADGDRAARLQRRRRAARRAPRRPG